MEKRIGNDTANSFKDLSLVTPTVSSEINVVKVPSQDFSYQLGLIMQFKGGSEKKSAFVRYKLRDLIDDAEESANKNSESKSSEIFPEKRIMPTKKKPNAMSIKACCNCTLW